MGNLLCHSIIRQCSLIRVAVLFELHVAKEERGGDDAEEGRQIFLVKTHDEHGLASLLELGNIVDASHGQAAVREERVRLGILENKLFALFGTGTGQQLVKDVEGSLVFGLTDRARFL